MSFGTPSEQPHDQTPGGGFMARTSENNKRKFFERTCQQEMANAAALQPLRDAASKALVAEGGWGVDIQAWHQMSDVWLAETIKLPGSTLGVMVLDGVLPPEWCAAFIKSHEAIGFTPQHVLDELTAAGAAKKKAIAQAAEEVCLDAGEYPSY